MTTNDQLWEGILAAHQAANKARMEAAARQAPFVLLLPTDPLPTGLAAGTIVVRAAAASPAPQTLSLTGTINNTVDANPARVDISSIPNGYWMIAVTSTFNTTGTTLTGPAGWTQIVPTTVAGTLRMAAWAKIKSSADTSVTIDQGQTLLHATSVVYGPGVTSIGTWIVSAVRNRSTTTATTTVANGLANVPAGSITLAFSGERTTADEATEPTATAPKVTYMEGTTANGIETLYIARPTDPTTATTFTYPNSQTSNGMAFTIAVTP